MQDVANIRGHYSSTGRLISLVGLLICTVVVSWLLTLAVMDATSAVDGFVVGENLWSKALHHAVDSLVLYGETRDSVYYQRFRQELAVPLSDRQARIESDKPSFNYAEVYASLRDAGNPSEDIPAMIRLYRCCAGYSYLARAMAVAKEGDARVAQLLRLGDALHKEADSPAPSRHRIETLLEQVRGADAAIGSLDDAFVSAMSEVGRLLKSALVWAIFAIAVVLGSVGIYLFARLWGQTRRTESDYRLLVNAFAHTADGIMILDAKRRIVAVNNAFTTITGYVPEEAVGRMLVRPQTMKIPGPTLHSVWSDTQAAGRWEGELWNVRKSGELFPMRLSLSAVYDKRHNSVGHYVAVFNDISSHKSREKRLQHLATHDTLTGLPNRAELERRCYEAIELACRHKQRLAVLYIDLDNFKPVNDACGHAVGDALLKSVAGRMRQAVRETDTVARVGGDEFSVILTELEDISQSYVAAYKLLDALSVPVIYGQTRQRVGASIGISIFPDDGADPQILLSRADAAMYRVKQGGRNGVAFYSLPAGLEPRLVAVMERNAVSGGAQAGFLN